jgi:hypothetical protein
MPYASAKQRRFMYSQKPEIASRWDKEGKNYIAKSYKHHKYGRKEKK